MLRRRFVIAALVLVGLALATLEESFVHSDDGCVIETHCNACLLLLGKTDVVGVAFSLPRADAPAGLVDPALPVPHADPTARCVSSRGPPPARTRFSSSPA
jgi:hypothetical protein